MLARCISNKLSSCQGNPDLVEFLRPSVVATEQEPLIVGAEYLVVAFSFGLYTPWLYIADRFGLRYPLICASPLFSIVDARCSRFWVPGVRTDRLGGHSDWLAPKEFIDDCYLPGNAFEGDPAAMVVYEGIVEKLSLEFALPWIKEHAVPLGKDLWVSDPEYKDAWEVDPSMEMTVRPSDGKLFHNPLHKSSASTPGSLSKSI
jgi:hypothetical protein